MPLHNRGGKAPSVLSLAQGPDGDLWVGTFGDGVYRLGRDGRLRHNYAAADGMPGGNIRAISVDPQGVVWAGTQKGVVRIDGDRVQVSNVVGMPSGLITALEHDHQGNLWIGTIEGIRVLRGDHVQSIDLAPMGGGRSVFGFHQLGDAMRSEERRVGKVCRSRWSQYH